ncbi:MAG: fatty acid desaturase family protein [Halioglobus sp.]
MKIDDYLSRADVVRFTAKSDLHALRLVVGNWLFIGLIFAFVAQWTNPLTLLIAVPLLAGRQLGLSVLMHDCGHRTLFRTQWMNDVLGQWLCALPVLNDQPSYARGHLEHHRRAGSHDDPDLPNYAAYPIPRTSFRRKVVRDLTGQTGFKLLKAIVKRGASGVLSREASRGSVVTFKQIFVQIVIFAALAVAGIAWAYLLWAVAYLTVFMLIVRVRQVAEHAAVPDLYDPDVRHNTRTVDAPWWQKWVFAPFGVNYHLEHHFMASVPCYRLKALRQHLLQAGALDDVPRFTGYKQLIDHAVLPV